MDDRMVFSMNHNGAKLQQLVASSALSTPNEIEDNNAIVSDNRIVCLRHLKIGRYTNIYVGLKHG